MRGMPSGADRDQRAQQPRREQRRRARRRRPRCSVLSTSSWLARRARPPPSAARTASSCCRAAPRAISRFATLTHAISSRKPTAPNSTSSVSRTSFDQAIGFSGSTRTRDAGCWCPDIRARVAAAIVRSSSAARLDRDARLQPSERDEALVVAAIEQLAGARRADPSRRRRRRAGCTGTRAASRRRSCSATSSSLIVSADDRRIRRPAACARYAR